MVKWHPIEDILFSASYDNTIKVWKHESTQDDWICLKTITEHTDTVWCIDFNEGGTLLISSGDDLKIILWTVKIDQNKIDIVKVAEIDNVHERSIFSCAFSNTKLNLFASVI